MIRKRALIVLFFAATACQASPGETPDADAPPVPDASPIPDVSPVAKAREVERETALYEFSYSYPAQAVAIPKLAAMLEKELDRSEARLKVETAEGKADAEEAGYPYQSYYLAIGWDVAADLPGWLSLAASVESYSGGAHPNHGFDSLLWDKQAGKRRKLTELFRSPQALRDAIRKDLCAAIDKEREERRGEPVDPNGEGIFDECIDPLEAEIVPESSDGKAFDSLSVLVEPYLAGPYAEGDYVIELPVTASVRAALRPEYASAFAK